MSRGKEAPEKSRPKTPKYRLHRATGQGYVELDGRCVYFGRCELPESRQKYHTLIAEWEANHRTLSAPPDEITVAELLDQFWQHAKTHYRRADGTHTGEHLNYRKPIKLMRELYGDTKAVEFGPRRLRTVRQAIVDSGNCRNTANSHTRRVRHIFRWAVGQQLIPEEGRTVTAADGLPPSGPPGRSRPSRSRCRGCPRRP